jgi:hypothetical protein
MSFICLFLLCSVWCSLPVGCRFGAVCGQVSGCVVGTGFRASDGDNAAAVIDDVDRDLPTHAGTAAENS